MYTRRNFLKAAGTAGFAAAIPQLTQAAENIKQPNIVLILADDMGIDSVQDLNEKCGISTPCLNGLFKQGMSFSDAHSNSAVCSPTRYGILTGRYAWRTPLKSGVVLQWEYPLIKADRLTLPGMLKNKGYNTACIGKWHLGMGWGKRGGGVSRKIGRIDFNETIKGGPTTRGFDYFFGVDLPNWPPFVWIENDRTLGIPSERLSFEKHYRSGGGIGVKGWSLEAVLPKITEKCVTYIGEKAKEKAPFFLYFAMTSPHTPIAPSKPFQGKSGISRYADFLMETDWSVGQVLKALDDNGISENTVVIFTTDNGTSPQCDFADLKEKDIDLQYNWRGMKADAWEGGHRVPFIVRWPGNVKPGSKSDQIISLVDIMATCAELVGTDLPDSSAEDSVSLLPVLKGKEPEDPLHEAIICHSHYGVYAVRKGKWKLQYSAGSGGWSVPKDKDANRKGLPKWQLYDLSVDPKESNNIIDTHPEVVTDLTATLRGYVEKGRSTPGEPQENHNGDVWWPGLPWSQDNKIIEEQNKEKIDETN